MAKKYILKSLDTDGRVSSNGNRPFERNLLNLSALGIKWNSSLIKNIRTDSDVMGNDPGSLGYVNSAMVNDEDYLTRSHMSIAGQNDYIAYYDQTYQARRDFLRKFALQDEIVFTLETIADEVIINDEMHYFAYPNVRKLRNILKPEKGKEIVDGINNAYRRIYHMFNFNEGNDAWSYVYKFLIEGFLAFEIIYDSTSDGRTAKNIIGFKELDPITMKPEIRLNSNGQEYKVWIINEGDDKNERVLLDTNVIYISWSKNGFVSHVSYCERLIRSFNMLRTLENSRLIWNIQNAQKRMKIVVPIGTESEQIAKSRLRALEALYKEDIYVTDYGTVVSSVNGKTSTASGIRVNANPNFSYAKVFLFPSKEGTTTDISEISTDGYNMSDIEQMKWFWHRFVIASKVPISRFSTIFSSNDNSAIMDNSASMTREEYRFSLFVDRIRYIFSEMLLKPTWLQFCLQNPEFRGNDVIKNEIGLEYCEDNIFRHAKENANLKASTDVMNTLSQIVGPDGKPVFCTKFLTQKYLDMSEDDWKLNEKMKEDEEKEMLKKGRKGADGSDIGFGGLGPDMGGGMPDMGGGMPDMGGGLGGDMGGGPDMGGGAPEAEAGGAPETAATEL